MWKIDFSKWLTDNLKVKVNYELTSYYIITVNHIQFLAMAQF